MFCASAGGLQSTAGTTLAPPLAGSGIHGALESPPSLHWLSPVARRRRRGNLARHGVALAFRQLLPVLDHADLLVRQLTSFGHVLFLSCIGTISVEQRSRHRLFFVMFRWVTGLLAEPHLGLCKEPRQWEFCSIHFGRYRRKLAVMRHTAERRRSLDASTTRHPRPAL